MMRAGDRACVAVRRPDGLIETRAYETRGWAESFATAPFVRGIAALAESLAVGIDALRWSEIRAMPREDGRQPAPVWLLLAIALGAVVTMIVVIPALVAGLAPAGSFGFGAVETIARLAIAGGYVAAVARRPEVRRVFEYHGAEHLVVAAHETNTRLTPASVRAGSIRHPRCGTSFLLVISAIAAAVHPLLPVDPVSTRIVTRVLVVPVVAAIAFEALTVMGKVAAARPGGRVEALLLWPQRFTTRQPDDDQIEVAIAALEGALATAPDATDAPAVAEAYVPRAS